MYAIILVNFFAAFGAINFLKSMEMVFGIFLFKGSEIGVTVVAEV